MNEILKKIQKKRIEQLPYRKIHPYMADVNDAYNQGFEDGAEFALRNQWISVDEALPNKKEYDWVLIRIQMNDGFICVPKVGEIRSDGYWHCAEYDDLYKMGESFEKQTGCKVTHWMPIPEMEK